MKLRSLTARLAALLCACGFVGYAQALTVEGYELPTMQATILNPKDSEFQNNNLNELMQPLDYAVHFSLPLTDEQREALDGNYFVDFVLTLNKNVLVVDPAAIIPQIQNGSLSVQEAAAMSAGCIVGATNPSNPWWIAVPSMQQMQLLANTQYKVCTGISSEGTVSFTLPVSKTQSLWGEGESGFDCGIWFTPGFHAANPDLVITLEPRLYKYDLGNGHVDMGSLGETLRFPRLPEAEVSVKDAAGLAALLERNEEDVAALMSDLGQDWITRFTKENNEPSLTSMSWRTYSTSTKDVFVFQAKDKSEDIMSTYGDWYCDYVVSFDQDVAADSVILTGAYGTQLATILVGMPFEGNNVTKQFLISSMGFNMNYNAIVENVGTFICTAINISRENIGKTINVSLVMWPSTGNKETDSVTITTIPYTFTEANLSSIKIPGDGAEYRFVSTDLDEDGLVCNGSSFVAQTEAGPHFSPVAYVAQIGETKYETLAAAINAAQSGDTVKLLTDVTVSEYVGITKSITLDGDNHILTVNATRGIRVSSGDVSVTIKNLTIPVTSGLERAIQVDSDKDNVALTIDNVTAEATYYTVNICAGVDDLVLKIKSSNLTGYGVANLWGNDGSVEIDSSTLTGVNTESYNAWNNFGVIIAEGDTTGQTDLHATAYTITVKDTTIVSTSTYGNKQSAVLFNAQSVGNTVVLDGCTITRGNENCTFFLDNGSANITKVRNTVDDATHELPILPFGYCYAAPDADGYRLITKAVAEVAGEYYATLAEAVAATDEGTINLIRDASGAGIFIGANAGKSITIDFGGYTYTVVGPAVGSKGTESQAFHLEKGNSVTLKNGNVTATTDSGVLMLVQNYCDLTLDDIVLDGSENSNISYVVSNNNGSMTATGSTCILAAEGKVAFDVCATSYYPEGVTVTFDSNFEGFVEGKVEYDVWGSIPANNKATLTIEEGNDGWFVIDWQVEEALAQAAKSNFNIAGGTFTTDVPADYCADGFIPTSFVDEDDGETYYAVRPANYVAQIGSTKYESFAAAVEAVQNDDTIVLLSDTTVAMGYAKRIGESGYGEGVGANRLVISTDKTFTVDLGGHVLMGRINFARGNMTLVNGTVRASSQALNIFGSKDYAYAGREYSVITVGADVTVEANYALCIFAGDPNYTYYPIGFGEVFNVYGKIKANSPVYVSGNVGMDTYVANCGTLADVEALKESTSKGVSELMSLYGPTINIYDGAELIANPSSAASDSSQGVSLSGCAIVNVFGGKITGAEGVGIKGGILNVSGGTITGTGAKCDPVQAVSSGTESSGAAISASTNYNANYPIEINVTGGIIKSVNNAALLVAHSVKSGTPVKAVNGIGASISGGSFIGGATEEAVIIESALEGEDDLYPEKFISGGFFSTKVPDGYCADGLVPTTKPTANGLYTVVEPATVSFAEGDTELNVTLPDSFQYPSGDLAEIALSLPTYTSADYTFGGWQMTVGDKTKVVSALPAGTKGNVTLVATWTKATKIAVEIVVAEATQETQEVKQAVEIKVTDEWVEANVEKAAEEATTTEIQTALTTTQANGYTGLENYLLGLDGKTATAKVKVESEQGASETAMPVKNTLAEKVQTADTGFTVKYSLDKVGTDGEVVENGEGAKQDTSDLELNLKAATSGDSNVAYYKMTATITKTVITGDQPTEVEVSTVHSENTIGVLAVKEAPATAIIGVPWSSSTDSKSISVNDLVRTANLTPGDEMKVYDPATKTYKMWELNEDKEWEPVNTSSGSGTSNPGEAQDNTVARGAGVWLTRKNPDEPIYLVGQATAEAAATPLETPESSDDPTWNLVASPSVEPVDLAVLLEGTTTDSVMVPTESAPKNFIKIGDKWGYVSYETVNGRARPSFKTDDTKVSAGTGFWYLNGDSTKTDKKLNW